MDAPFVRPGRLLPPKKSWGKCTSNNKDGATIDNQWLGFREIFCVFLGMLQSLTIFDMNCAFGMGLNIVPPKSVVFDVGCRSACAFGSRPTHNKGASLAVLGAVRRKCLAPRALCFFSRLIPTF